MGKSIAEELAEKTFEELKLGKYGKVREDTGGNRRLPFRIPAVEKTTRRAASTQGYKASAYWQTASLLRDLFTLWFESLPPVNSLNLPLFSRLKSQVLDALRSVVSTLEEGWARPSTKEYLDFIGFSQASLAEVRGNTERMMADGLLRTERRESGVVGSEMTRLGIPTPSRANPYPPVRSRKFPEKYGKLRERVREYTGKEPDARDFTYELFVELINKVDYLLKNTVSGLQIKIIKDQNRKLKTEVSNHWGKYW